MSHVSIGLRTEKTENNPHGYREVEKIPANEVCVLYLGGDGSTTDKQANGYAKIIENEILNSIETKIPVYSVRYDFREHNKEMAIKWEFVKHHYEMRKKNIAQALADTTPEIKNPKYINDLFNQTILSRISDDNGQQRLSAQDAAKRIRKLNIVAHCHGGYVALKLEEKMQAKMQELGYSRQEQDFIQSQMLIVAHAPACVMGVSKSQFISFHSVYDSSVPSPNNLFYNYIVKNRGREISGTDNDTKKIDEDKFFDFKPSYFSGKHGNMFIIKRKYKDETLDVGMVDENEHNDVSYTAVNQTKEGRIMAAFAKNILQNSIENSLLQEQEITPLPSLGRLILRGTPDIQAKQQKVFQMMKENGNRIWHKIVDEIMKANQKIINEKKRHK